MDKYKLLQHHINQILFNSNDNKLVDHVNCILTTDKKYRYKALNDNDLLKYIDNNSNDQSKKTIVIAGLLSCLLQWRQGTQKEVAQLLSRKQNFQLPYGYLFANCWDAVYLAIFYLELKLNKYCFAREIYDQRLLDYMDISGLESNAPSNFLSSEFACKYNDVTMDHYKIGSIVSFYKAGSFAHVGLYLGMGMVLHHLSSDGFKVGSIKDLLYRSSYDKNIQILSLDDLESTLMDKNLGKGVFEGKAKVPTLTMIKPSYRADSYPKINALE